MKQSLERQSKSHINGNATSKKWAQAAVIEILFLLPHNLYVGTRLSKQ